MQTDWQEGKPPTHLDVEVYAHGSVRKGSFDGVYFHFSSGGAPESNAICSGEDICAWRHTPSANPQSAIITRNQLGAMNSPRHMDHYLGGAPMRWPF